MFGQPRSIFFLLVAVLSGLSACASDQGRLQEPRRASGTTVSPVDRSTVTRTPAEKAAITAVRQLGTPYQYGGTSPNGFDCSGLVVFAYHKAGVDLPRTTAALWRELDQVKKRDLRTGDLLFFKIGGKVSHVGMYLGSGRFIHSPATGREVSFANLESGYYRQTFAGAARPY